jgi:hypothetical protein
LKKIISLLICFFLVFNSSAYVFFYWQVKNLLKEQGLSNSQNFKSANLLIKIVIPSYQTLNSKRFQLLDDHEIRYDGKMYDIVKRDEVNGDIILLCISDENEDKLEKAFINHIENNNNDKSTTPVKNILKQLIADGLVNILSESFSSERVVKYTSFFINNYQSPLSEITDPPPNLVC